MKNLWPSVEELADWLEALCTEDDMFASREAAEELAWEFLTRAQAGDPVSAFLIDRTRDYLARGGVADA